MCTIGTCSVSVLRGNLQKCRLHIESPSSVTCWSVYLTFYCDIPGLTKCRKISFASTTVYSGSSLRPALNGRLEIVYWLLILPVTYVVKIRRHHRLCCLWRTHEQYDFSVAIGSYIITTSL